MKQELAKNNKIKIKLYGTWREWNNEKEAVLDLLSWAESCEGAERDRYMSACFEIKRGLKVIDTDNN